jgi:hypothetical protein
MMKILAMPGYLNDTSPTHLNTTKFQSIIEFVGPNVGLINPMVDLKMRCVGYIFISFLVLLRS